MVYKLGELPAKLPPGISPRDAVVLALGKRNLVGYIDVTKLYAAAKPTMNGQGETPEQFREFLREEAARPDALIVLGSDSAFAKSRDGCMLSEEGIRYALRMQPKYPEKKRR